MITEHKETIAEAIRYRKVIKVVYESTEKGLDERTFYPFTIGETKHGKDIVKGFQASGGSGEHFAAYNLENMKTVEILNEEIPEEHPEKYGAEEGYWGRIDEDIKKKPVI